MSQSQFVSLAILVTIALPAPAGAQAPAPDDADETAEVTDDATADEPPAQPHLSQAEAAYLDIDFERVRTEAQLALAEGGHDPQEVTRIYKLIGLANAALGEADAARSAFVRMLMLDPEATVNELSPDLRSPYLEARGRIGALSQRFTVETALSRPQSAIIIRLTDPTHLASRVVIKSRVGGEGNVEELDSEAAPEIAQRLEGLADAGWAEYSLVVLDEDGNRLAAIGDETAPVIIGEPITRLGPEEDESKSIFASPWFWVVTAAVIAGAVVGGYFLFFSDPTWNGQTAVCYFPGC